MTSTDLLKSLWRDESGQDMVEWALLLAFVALGSAALLQMNTEAMRNIWDSAEDRLEEASKKGL